MLHSIRLITAFATVFSCSLLQAQNADEKQAEDQSEGLTYREPFSGLSPNEIQSKLVVFLITDEDPFAWTKAKLEQANNNRLGGGPDVWCGREFRKSFQKLFVSRPDLKDLCIAQRVVAGLPSNLTAGVRRPLPSRAIIAICDGNYRLLTLSVGVPQSDDLLRLIEDAEEAKTMLSLHGDDPEKVMEAVAARTHSRIRRVYGETLQRLAEPMAGDESLYTVDEAWIAKYARMIAELQPTYFFDIKLRFGLSDAGDLVRLIVLEQHCETRQNWCDTVAPFVVGRPFRELIHPLVDTTWGTPAVLDIDATQHEELLSWFSSRRENSTVVLSIKPTHLDRGITWPPPNVSRNPLAKRDWNALEAAMSKHPFRSLDAEQLAVILRANDEMSVDLFSPARARYVFFEADKRKPFLIRENDLPGKFLGRLEVD